MRFIATVATFMLLLTTAVSPVSLALARAQDEPAGPARVGDPVSFATTRGDEPAMTMTVTGIVDPFAAFGPQAPPKGERYVFISLTIANGGEEPFEFDPATVFVQDSDGYVSRPTNLFGGEDLAQIVAAGESVIGGVAFSVPEAASLVAIYHDPADDRLIVLADLRAPAAAPATTSETTQPASTAGEPQPAADASPVVSGEIDCTAYETYYTATAERLDTLAESAQQLGSITNMIMSDPTGAAAQVQTTVAAIVDLRAEQEDEAVPAGVDDLNDRILDMYDKNIEGLEGLATMLSSLSSGVPDMAGIQTLQTSLGAAEELNREVIDDLKTFAESCGVEVIE